MSAGEALGGGGPRIAVVGAGFAGLACARELVARRARVTVFEREHVPGGRVATCALEAGSYDAGAQYLTVQLPRFEAEVARWTDAGIVQPWHGKVIEFAEGRAVDTPPSQVCHVGVPAMQSIAQYLARDLDVIVGATVGRLVRGAGAWYLFDDRQRQLGVTAFDAVVLALPSPEAAALAHGLTDLEGRMAEVRWDPCWTAMLGLTRRSGVDFDGAFVTDDPILGWIARDSAKPMRERGDGIAERWLLQARPSWSRNYLEMSEADAARWMQRAFAARIGRPLAQRGSHARRWRLSTPVNPLPQPFLWDEAQAIGCAGDWCGGPRIEGAFLSGVALAEAIAG